MSQMPADGYVLDADTYTAAEATRQRSTARENVSHGYLHAEAERRTRWRILSAAIEDEETP